MRTKNRSQDIPCQRFLGEEVFEITTMLYRSTQIPTLLMLLCSIACVWILRNSAQFALLSAWALFVASLAILRFVVLKLFERASVAQQAALHWRIALLLCACVSGLTLGVFACVFVPEVAFNQQVILLGLVALVAASACMAYAVNGVLFVCYTVSGFSPTIWVYLNADSEILHGLGLLALMYVVAMTAAAYQVNRLLHQSLKQRLKNQKLIQTLQKSQAETEFLNTQLTAEVSKKEAAEHTLLAAQAHLEERVSARTIELEDVLQALGKSQESLELALDASQLAFWDWDLVSDEIHHTRTKSIFGLEDAEVRGVLTDLRPLLHPDDLPVLRTAMIEHMQQKTEGYAVEYRVKHHDGRWIWVEDRGRAVERNSAGRVLRMLGTRRDITLAKQRDEELRLASSVFDAGIEGIIILDPEYNILTVNKAFTAVTGYSRADVLGKNVLLRSRSAEVTRQYQAIRLGIEQQGSWQGEMLDTRKNGEVYPQWLQIHVMRDKHGNITHIVGFLTDLTSRREAEERLTYLTQYDDLTGLSNRSLFHKRLHQAVDHARRDEGCMALLHIDIDRFKVLNDSLGIETADQVLRQVSRRLTQLLPEANTLARLGGNEFAVILDNCESSNTLVRLCTSILARIHLPIEVAGNELIISASIGISVLPANAREPATLMTQANMAMQHAKHLGGNNFQFYNDQLQTCTLERLQLEQQLRRGIEEGQLEAYYQPKLTLADGQIRSAEALVRWNHPQLGLVPPSEFIALAEETGLITAITELMLEQACQQALLWLEQGMPIRVSVNLSVSHVRQGKLVTLIRHVLQKTGLPAHLCTPSMGMN
ncbi:MAG: diguanylate cyclase [Pseudomonas sp.]|nr:diguanylate cyclase [Pseudomonas sp.]